MSGNITTPNDFIDIHCHVLPDVDDGPRTMEASLEMLKVAAGDGISTIVATPHRLDGVYDCSHEMVQRRLAELRRAASEAGIPIELLPGADVHLHEDLVELVRRDPSLTLCGQGKYLMLEMPADSIPFEMPQMVFRLLVLGVVPIISHPERNARVRERPQQLLNLVRQGALVQVTAASLLGECGRRVRECTRRLLQHGAVHFIATDAHDAEVRAPLLAEAVRVCEEWVGTDETLKLVVDNPRAAVTGETIDPGVPRSFGFGSRRANGTFAGLTRRLPRWANGLVMLLLLGSVALFGAVHAEFQFPLIALVLLAGACWWTGRILSKRPLLPKTWLNVPILLFLIFALLTIVPLPANWLRWVGIERSQEFATISSSPYLTGRTLAVAFAAALVFWIASARPSRRRHVLTTLTVLVLIGAAQALYGLFEHLSGNKHLLWRTKVHYLDSVTGTFVNRNHFATLIAMLLPVALGCALHWWTRGRGGRKLRERWFAHDPQGRLSRTVLFGFLVVAMMVGLFFSLSRGGLMAAAAGVSATVVVMLFRQRLRKAILLVAPLALVTVGTVAWLGWQPMRERIQAAFDTDLSTNFRFETWHDTVAMIEARPVTGWGAGTFREVYPRFKRADYSRLEVRHAHNDYLELVAETGLIGGVLMGWIVIGLLWTTVRGFAKTESASEAALLAGLAGAMVAAMTAVFFDFSLHLPAVLWVAAAIAGTTAAAARLAAQDAAQRRVRKLETVRTARAA